jgi:hypothetical protein
MKYLLMNFSDGNMQLNLHTPVSNAKHGLHRGGPVLALKLERGHSVDLLKHFSSLQEARAVLRASKDVLRVLQPGRLVECLVHDNGQQIKNIDAYMKNPTPPSPPAIDPAIFDFHHTVEVAPDGSAKQVPLVSDRIPVPTEKEVIDAGYSPKAAKRIVAEQKEKVEIVSHLEQERGQSLTDEEVVEALHQHEDAKRHEDTTVPALEVAAVMAFEERKKIVENDQAKENVEEPDQEG